jgi:predicted RNase H-like nuclease (RuvC/YqgF family)
MSEGFWALLASLLALAGVIVGAWLQLRGKKVEVAQQREDSVDQQESVLRSDLFRSWEREKKRADDAEESKKAMADIINELNAKVTQISVQAEEAAKEVKSLRAKVTNLEKELHQEQANNQAKQKEINELNKEVARLSIKVASLESNTVK